MNGQKTGRVMLAVLAIALVAGGGVRLSVAQIEDIPKPAPDVVEVFTLLGEFVRVAYNNEGYTTLTYRVANESVGDEWMLLDVGLTVRRGTKNQDLTRDAISLLTPDGTSIPLASQTEYSKAKLNALDARANRVMETPNYFPAGADTPCRAGFFTDTSPKGRGAAFDKVNLSFQRACVGRLYFQVPGGIQTGQHYLQVVFAESTLQVPFRILTKEEGKEFKKKWKDIKKEHDAENEQGKD